MSVHNISKFILFVNVNVNNDEFKYNISFKKRHSLVLMIVINFFFVLGPGGIVSPQPGTLPAGAVRPGTTPPIPQPGQTPAKQSRVTTMPKPMGLDPLTILQERENR